MYKKAVFIAYKVKSSFVNNCVLPASNFCTNEQAENCDRLQILKTLQKRGGENPEKQTISEGNFLKKYFERGDNFGACVS